MDSSSFRLMGELKLLKFWCSRMSHEPCSTVPYYEDVIDVSPVGEKTIGGLVPSEPCTICTLLAYDGSMWVLKDVPIDLKL